MDYSALFDFFQRVERESVVQQWMVDDLHVWPLVRINFGAAYTLWMCDGNGERDTNCGESSPSPLHGRRVGAWLGIVAKALSDEVRCRFLDAEHQQKNEPCDVVILGESVLRNVKMPSGEAFDSLLDPIAYTLQAEKYKVFRFELVGPGSLKLPRWGKSTPISFMQLWARIRRKWAWERRGRMEKEEKMYGKIMKEFSQLTSGFRQMPWEEVAFQILFIRYLAESFQRKMEQISPKVVILDCWYSSVQMALSVAAHRLGIPVVEVQHGAIGVHHAYYVWKSMPSRGYEVMPNYMWVWRRDEVDSIACWGRNKMVPFLAGKPMNLVWGNPSNNWAQYYHGKYEKDYGNGRPAILFTLQWGTEYPDWISDFINQSNEYTWLIRLHPYVDNGERLFLHKLKHKNNIICETVSSFPLEILLIRASLHVTMYSGVVIDGEMAGLSSIVLHPKACEMFALQMKRGIVRYAGNREDLSEGIRDILTNRNIRGGNKERVKEFYAQGCAGIQKLVEIMETSQPCYELQNRI